MYYLILKQSECIKYLRTYRTLLNVNIVKDYMQAHTTHTYTHTLTGIFRPMFAFLRVQNSGHECISDFFSIFHSSFFLLLFLLLLSSLHILCITPFDIENSVYRYVMYGKWPNAFQSTALMLTADRVLKNKSFAANCNCYRSAFKRAGFFSKTVHTRTYTQWHSGPRWQNDFSKTVYSWFKLI